MSLYVELKNWDGNGDKTFLVHSFNIASQYVEKGKGLFRDGKWVKDPGVTHVVLEPGGFRNGGVSVEIAIGYEDFKRALLSAASQHQIPSFNYKKKYVFGE